MKKFVICLVYIALISPSSFAKSGEIPESLDIYERRSESYRFEVNPYIGYFVGDALQHSLMLGGMVDFRLTPKLSIGTDFAWSRISYDPAGSFGSIVTNKNLYSILGFFTINTPAAYLSRDDVVETDFFSTIGGGILRINNSNRGAGFVGVGIKTYTNFAKWLGFRLEFRNYFSSVRTATGTDFTADMTLLFGPTFMIPPKLF